MTDLEVELRELLLKYGFDVCEMSIIFTNTGQDILEIVIEDIQKESEKECENNLII